MAILTETQIKNKLTSIKKNQAKFIQDVQEILISHVAHASQHGDVSMATRLFEAMGNGARKQAIVSWLEEFGIHRFDAKDQAFKKNTKKAETFSFNEEHFRSLPLWSEYTKENVKSMFDFESQWNSLIKKLESKMEKDPESIKDMEHAQKALDILKTGLIQFHVSSVVDENTVALEESVAVSEQRSIRVAA